MEELLTDAGLTKLQARAYLYLLKNGASFPGRLTAKLKITRTNTYKVLESLEKLGLATREEKDKKVIYIADDPVALASLVAEKRNNVIALERNVSNAMQRLRSNYHKSQNNARVRTSKGKESIVREYEQQAESGRPIFYVRTRADIPFMGFEAMDNIRVKQGRLAQHRFGITPDSTEASIKPNIDISLTRTWLDEKDYTAPVEWSVSGESLILQVFDGEGRTIAIHDKVVAEAFRQLWHLLDKVLRNSPSYQTLPLKAKRTI